MSNLKKELPKPLELWGVAEIMHYAGYGEEEAQKILRLYSIENPSFMGGYHTQVEKDEILDFIDRYKREELERLARLNADVAVSEMSDTFKAQVKALEEQVSVLRKMSKDSSQDAKKARRISCFATAVSFLSFLISLIVAIVSLASRFC